MFTTPCFIRKNTPELVEKLEDLGYKKDINYLENDKCCCNLYVKL